MSACPCRTSRIRAALTVVLALAAAAGGGSATAQQPAAGKAVPGPSVEGLTEYALPNGLRVLLFPDQSKPTTTVNVTYFVGSRHESYGETGMAHLLEHLVFKGTPRHPNIPQELTEHGASPNGSTWFDRTNYFETFPATEEHLAWALDLEADRMVNSFISADDLASEMTVVRNEFELGENDPTSVLLERTLSTAFLWHNYGNSTIGARSDLEHVPIERLQGFYRKYYQPDNALLIVAGKFDPARALALIEGKFGAIPRADRSGAARLWSTYTAEPTQDGERSVTLRRVGDVQVLMAAYHVPPGSHADFAAVDVLAHVLGTEPSGRLYRALVAPGLAASVRSFNFQLREPGVLVASAQVRKEDPLAPARDAFLAALDSVASLPPSGEEVERARTELLKNIDLTLNNSARVGLELSEWAAMGDWRLFFLHRDRIRSVTAADVARVAREYFKPSNRTLGIFLPTPAPDRAEIPATPDVAALVKDYRGDTTLAAGEAFDPSPANIDSRTTRYTLPGGLEVALLPKETRGNTVAVNLQLHFGTERALTGRGTAAGIAGEMLMRGTTSHTRQQLKDEFDRLKARVRVNGGAEGAFASVETVRENLPAVLRLVGEVLRHPAFDSTEFEALRQERLAQLEEQLTEPTARAVEAIRRHLAPWPAGHPSHVETLEEQIAGLESLTLDAVRRFHAGFYGVGAGELAVVGDFDPAEVRPVLAEAFGGWKSPAPYARVADRWFDVPPISRAIETPDKANAFFVAGLNLPMRDDDPAYPAMVLANYMLGGGFLNSRLAVRIRQQEGLSYGVGSQFAAPARDSAGAFLGYAISAPENSAKVDAAFREEIVRAVTDGFTAEEVGAAKDGYLQSRQVRRAQDGALAGMLTSGLFLDRTMAWDDGVEAKIRALTPDQVAQALRKYVDPAKISVVRAGDFTKVPTAEAATP